MCFINSSISLRSVNYLIYLTEMKKVLHILSAFLKEFYVLSFNLTSHLLYYEGDFCTVEKDFCAIKMIVAL